MVRIFCKCGDVFKIKPPTPNGRWKSYAHCKRCNLTWVKPLLGSVYSHPWKVPDTNKKSGKKIDFHHYDNPSVYASKQYKSIF